MPRTQPYYIVSIEGKLSATFIPRVVGVFSTPALAVASVKKITPRCARVPNNSEPGVIRCVGDDSDIKIELQHSDIVGTSITPANTVFLAIDECGDSIVETKISGTAHDAWAACEAMKRDVNMDRRSST
ncbi:uncharacterized protein J4E79_006783 [Alternaria viburni]|uniref:uncharacterized protein n=1 Tax=Alternaria viburni TaxID=566460 RepID=UPI0020C4650B|nr:uncharacterized protein J4E79_006783 [Alternaria viburni]KAI4658378.1 hypothetical protein J4E79_006783 [Alternaria viburni]